jgi:alkanesulfonate monooxygenase SsuD/methylene tetrahydromethanopterin reductase-like flavin-dependent oxidoreductase (luciferase family)
MLAARETDRIELGTGVTNPGTRDAAATASAALALQLESGGRAVCGIVYPEAPHGFKADHRDSYRKEPTAGGA